MNTFWQILISLIGGGSFVTLLIYLINRHDERLGIIKRLDRNERDNCRIQLLIVLNHYEEDVPEIMRLAEHYFKDLNGDWYMTSLFNKWLERNHYAKPEWFDEKK